MRFLQKLRSAPPEIMSIGRWSEKELTTALEQEKLSSGPFTRTLPDGRVQHFAFVERWGPKGNLYGYTDSERILREASSYPGAPDADAILLQYAENQRRKLSEEVRSGPDIP
jgi:hypothetical protein